MDLLDLFYLVSEEARVPERAFFFEAKSI